MPLFGFVCEECQENFEELVISASNTDEVACPECGSPKVERQLSLVAALKSSNSGAVSAASSAACAPGG